MGEPSGSHTVSDVTTTSYNLGFPVRVGRRQ
jgi:hypothetical protein